MQPLSTVERLRKLLLFRVQTFTVQNSSAEALADARQALPVARR
jgi:hypothetical protein